MSTVVSSITSNTPAVASEDAGFVFDNTYLRDLPGLYQKWPPAAAPHPQMVLLNEAVVQDLGLSLPVLRGAQGAALLSGDTVPAGAEPLAQAYAGHQFGGFSPRLGDGRAVLLGEMLDTQGRRRDIAFKGSGRTPFSRGGDGKAAVGPMLREYLISEAMHALGIPTTRALAVVATGESVLRDSGRLPGAVLTRVAASHLRVGTFQYAAAMDDRPTLQRLLNYSLRRHDPVLLDSANPALALLQAVAERQAALLAQWMGVGFIHGVMNTDNMTISGETIDYGPCAFMDHYDPAAVFSSIDYHGRYAYANQPPIARWNLARLAETLLPLLADEPQQAIDAATAVIDDFPVRYEHHWLQVMRSKLGLVATTAASDASDLALAQGLLAGMQGQGVDFTLLFRGLTRWLGAETAAAPQALDQRQALDSLQALYADAAPLQAWLPLWQARLRQQPLAVAEASERMQNSNPAFIPRNHRVQAALDSASDSSDLTAFNRLLAVLAKPFDEQPEAEDLALPVPPAQSAAFQTFCGT